MQDFVLMTLNMCLISWVWAKLGYQTHLSIF